MELKQIYYFEQVCRYKSISKAASALYMSQQGVSKQIANLEKELGSQLFKRNSHGVALTMSGEYFHEQAKVILEARKNILDHFSVSDIKGQNILKIGVSRGLGAFINDSFLEGFSKRYKHIQPEVCSSWSHLIEDNINSDSIDVGILISPVRSKKIHVEPILQVPILCIVNANSPLAKKKTVSMNEILRHTIAIADENFNSYYSFSAICEKKKIKPDVVKMFDLLSIYEYVDQKEDAVGFTLDVYRSAIQYPNIRHLPIKDPEAVWEICMAWKTEYKNQNIMDFVTYTKQYMMNKEKTGNMM